MSKAFNLGGENFFEGRPSSRWRLTLMRRAEAHACCGVVSNSCCDASAPIATVFNPSAAPLPPPKPAAVLLIKALWCLAAVGLQCGWWSFPFLSSLVSSANVCVEELIGWVIAARDQHRSHRATGRAGLLSICARWPRHVRCNPNT